MTEAGVSSVEDWPDAFQRTVRQTVKDSISTGLVFGVKQDRVFTMMTAAGEVAPYRAKIKIVTPPAVTRSVLKQPSVSAAKLGKIRPMNDAAFNIAKTLFEIANGRPAVSAKT